MARAIPEKHSFCSANLQRLLHHCERAVYQAERKLLVRLGITARIQRRHLQIGSGWHRACFLPIYGDESEPSSYFLRSVFCSACLLTSSLALAAEPETNPPVAPAAASKPAEVRRRYRPRCLKRPPASTKWDRMHTARVVTNRRLLLSSRLSNDQGARSALQLGQSVGKARAA